MYVCLWFFFTYLLLLETERYSLVLQPLESSLYIHDEPYLEAHLFINIEESDHVEISSQQAACIHFHISSLITGAMRLLGQQEDMTVHRKWEVQPQQIAPTDESFFGLVSVPCVTIYNSNKLPFRHILDLVIFLTEGLNAVRLFLRRHGGTSILCR